MRHRRGQMAPWALVLLVTGTAAAQDVVPPAQPTERKDSAPVVREVGGRLVASDETVVVAGTSDLPTRDSSVATKIDTPLINTPRSITILDRRTLDDMAAVNITQGHDYSVGLTPQDERGPGFARGFPVDFYDLRRDGLRTYSWSVREPVALDRIQYLRGTASVLYGDGSPGAMVNLVLKKPLPVPRIELSASGGSAGFGRVTADATGPLNDTRTARYRVVGAAEWLDGGFDNDERRLTVFPAIALDLGQRATLSFDTELYHQQGRNYRHVVPATPAAQQGDFSAFPWDLSIASPDDGWSGSNIAPGLRLDVGLGAATSLHVAGRYTRIDGDLDLHVLAALSPDGQSLQRFRYREISTWNEYQGDVFLTTTARTGAVEHRLVAGVESGVSTTDTVFGVAPGAMLHLIDRQYGPRVEPSLSPVRFDVTRVGAYALDQIQLSKHVTLAPGLRWSRVAVDDRLTTTDTSDSLVSPSIGAVVMPRTWLAIYANYARGFEPPTPGQYLEDGRAPALSENWLAESGLKIDVFGGRMSLTAAGFRIERTNVPEADAQGFYRQIGAGESRGVEFEGIGLAASGLTVRAGYAYTRTEITRDLQGFTGRELPNAPRHKAHVWLRYRFSSTPLAGVTLAGGMVHSSDRFTARDNRVVAPSYTRFDATGSKELLGPRLTIGVVAENVTNLRYVRSGAGANLFAAPPRRVALQLTTAF